MIEGYRGFQDRTKGSRQLQAEKEKAQWLHFGMEGARRLQAGMRELVGSRLWSIMESQTRQQGSEN